MVKAIFFSFVNFSLPAQNIERNDVWLNWNMYEYLANIRAHNHCSWSSCSSGMLGDVGFPETSISKLQQLSRSIPEAGRPHGELT